MKISRAWLATRWKMFSFFVPCTIFTSFEQLETIVGCWVNMIVWIVVFIQQSCQFNLTTLTEFTWFNYIFFVKCCSCWIVIFNCMSFWTFYFIKWPVRKILMYINAFIVTHMLDLLIEQISLLLSVRWKECARVFF